MYTLAIIEDNADIREALSGFFRQQQGYEVCLVAASFEDFQRQWRDRKLDVVLCDIGLPGKSGVEAAWNIRQRSPLTQVVMLTVFEDRNLIFESLCSGATGYLLKNTPLVEIRRSVDEIMAGGAIMSPQVARQVAGFFSAPRASHRLDGNLTPREIQIVGLIQQGESNKDIADRLFIGINAVKYHIKNIYLKLQIKSREELVRLYRNPLG